MALPYGVVPHALQRILVLKSVLPAPLVSDQIKQDE